MFAISAEAVASSREAKVAASISASGASSLF